MTIGYFGLVLHGHMPWVKKSGIWPSGEEMLFEAMNETYIPFLNVLRDLKEKNIKTAITINITPILAEQFADDYMKWRFAEYMEDLIKRASSDIKRFQGHPKEQNLAKHYLLKFEEVLDSYYKHYYKDLNGTFKWLQDEGMIELITCGATHGFLPLLESDSGIFSQIQLAVDTHKMYFKTPPNGIWLPECAYRPKEEKNGKIRQSLDYWVHNSGIKYFFVDGHGIFDAEIIESNNTIGLNTNFGYKLETGVSVFGRNQNTSRQVWDAKIGYPGDPYYREFHRKDHESGLHYWRITEKSLAPENKQLYDVDLAQARVKSHANHFISVLSEEVFTFHKQFDQEGIIISPYDFELYGHWWMEGIDWLRKVFELIHEQQNLEIITLSEYISKYKSKFSTIRMKPSSWGEGGDFRVWKNQEHQWIWPYINSSIKDFENILELNPNPNELATRVLKQVARELLLMEGSDWPFLLYTEQAREYANQRFHHHHQRFNKLIWPAKDITDTVRLSFQDLEEYEDIDSCFSDLNLDYFRKKE